MSWLTKVLIAAILTLGVLVGFMDVRNAQLESQVVALQNEKLRADAAAFKKEAQLNEKYRQQEERTNEEFRRIAADRARDKENSDRTESALRADNGRMRNAIAEYARGGSETAGDSVAACQSRASTLGDVLGESLQLQIDLAAAAERHLRDARSLYEAELTIQKNYKNKDGE